MKNTFAIRGATTVEMDSPAQVDEAVCELFDRVLEENSLADHYREVAQLDIVSDQLLNQNREYENQGEQKQKKK